MLAWLSAHWVDLLLILALTLLVVFILRVRVLARRAGKSSCGCSCESCPGCCAKRREAVSSEKPGSL